MQPLQITFRNVQPSKAIERLVRQKAQKLEKLFSRIIKFHVTLKTRNQQHHKGNLYDVHIDLYLPGRSFAVTSTQHGSTEHELLSMAVREAFEAAERQLQDHAGARRKEARSSTAIHPDD